MNWPKIHCSRKFYPPKYNRYTVLSEVRTYVYVLQAGQKHSDGSANDRVGLALRVKHVEMLMHFN